MKDSLSCCVCLKEEPFENNPIVSCDGKNCSTTVHKECYGIQQIPDGAWFCQKCISQERTARVRCELCPSRDGALKHTNKGGWCHIICALFVPGAEFLDPGRLESISIDKVFNDKLNKMCTICEKNNRLDRATVGACIQCVKSGCKVLFHVTCAQSQGLLTEIVNSKEGVRYVAYCFAHKHKTKHRDFSIRLSNSSHSSTRYDKNKLRQTPPQLEKSDEDCVTPQDVSLDTDHSASSKNLNISSSSGNANFSSDSTSFDDSNDRIAPVICNSSEISEFHGKKKTPVQQYKKSLDILRPPNITTSEPLSSTDVSSLPPNLCCSEASESVAKEEATVKSSTGSVTSDTSSNRPVKRQATTSNSEIQPKKQKVIKSEQKSVIKAEMVVKQEKVKKARKVSQSTKTSKGVLFHKFDSDKIQALAELETRKEKKTVPPSRPTSIFSHMSSIMGGGVAACSSASTSMISTTSTSTTNKITGTTCQSMEELLEWQWDQTGTLLMQQAEASDIASLLSCLHDLKNENEQLLSKQLKLSHRRDHLKAVNAKLQLQLATKTNVNVTVPSITAPVVTNNSDRTVNRPPTMSNPQTSAKNISKSHKSTDQQLSNFKQTSLSNIPNGDIRTRQLSDTKPTFIQPQPQQQQSMLSNPGWGTSSKVDPQINQQTIALLKHYQQQHGLVATSVNQPVSSTPPVSNIITQTDLVTFLNNQLHSQLASNSQTTAILTATQKPISQDIHIASNNGNNMELIYQAIQQKKQQQQQQQLQLQQHSLPSHFFYHNTNKMPPSSSAMNNLENSVSQTPDKTLVRGQPGYQRTRPSESLCQQIRSAKPNSE